MGTKLEKGLSAFAEKIFSFEKNDRERIKNALALIKEHSCDSGSFVGPASILLDLGLDADTIIAALIRQLPVSAAGPADIVSSVSLLVQGLKKLDDLKINNKTVQEALNIRNMILVLAEDIRVVFIKLAEKLHEMKVLDSSNELSVRVEERKIAARECIDIYAPLADRLGISWMKNEMEDLSLKFLNRETFQQIKDIVSEKLDQRNKFLEFAQETIIAEAKAAGTNVTVKSRAKHFYSVYMKMRKRNKTAAETFDLAGIRIICDSVENCYTLLGVVHHLGRPGNGTFRDYIARPKPNGYQSLHTTIMLNTEIDAESDEEGKLLEIQIRTAHMHQIAEHGIASHWLYKKGASRELVQPEEIGIANRLKDWNQDTQDRGEFSPTWFEEIKRDILKKNIYVFTPQGKVIKLPAGGTPIDFAYQIHTTIGERCVGAKANGHIVPLKSQLENAQVVEIMTSISAHPNIGWLESVKSSKARSKIRSWLDKNDEFFSTEKTGDIKKKPDPLTVAAAQDRKGHVLHPVQPQTSVLKVRIGEEKNMMIRFARCCSPAPDGPITGYVSRGRGIIIHREKCINLANNPEVENRKIAAEWDDPEENYISGAKRRSTS